jgi:hypothetical protein
MFPDEIIEKLSDEVAEELCLDRRDHLYIKNVLLRFSVKMLENLAGTEKADV